MRITGTVAGLAAGPRHGGRTLDFVVLGFGIGALLVLLGLLVRDYGPRIRRLRTNQGQPWVDVATRVAWRRTCRAGGVLLAASGVLVGVATLIAVVARVNDQTGIAVVLITTAISVVGMVTWAARYRRVTTGFGLRRHHPSRHADVVPLEPEASPPIASEDEAVTPTEAEVETDAAVVNGSHDDEEDALPAEGDEAAESAERTADAPGDDAGRPEVVAELESINDTVESDEQPTGEPEAQPPPTPEASTNGREPDTDEEVEVTTPSAITQDRRA